MVSNPAWISIIVSLCVICLFIAWQLRREPGAVEERIQQYVEQAVPLEQIELERTFADRLLKPLAQSLVRVFGRLAPVGNAQRLRRDLMLAGNPGGLAMIDFLGIKILTAGATGAVATVILAFRMPAGNALLFGMAGALLGLYMPNFWLKRRIRARQKEISRALPDALDMMTIAVDAGLGFDAALLKVGEKWNNALSLEFERVVGEMRMGISRHDALRRLVERTDVPEVASFIAVLVQADRLGVGINNALHAQSDQMRIRRRQWAEEQARKAPIKMLIPMVIFIFPSIFAVILGPAVPRFVAAFAGG
ncbi:MAG: type II secretion system F family protein [Anaerolineae bacterium]|nr:type II secretion system F family protein [Anaerolineae bacterium]